jgi:DNA-directed RNA polymerase subunit RPC12/RpoP
MADFNFPCSACGEYVQYDDEWVGYEIQCPTCQETILVPDPSEAVEAAEDCPNCQAELAADALICMACGYNTETGQTLATSAPKKKKQRKAAGSSFRGTPLGNASAVMLVFTVLALVAFFAKLQLLFMVAAVAYVGFMNLWLLVAAFREGILHGLLTFFIGIYGLYFVYGVSDDSRFKALFSVNFYVIFLLFGLIFGSDSSSSM